MQARSSEDIIGIDVSKWQGDIDWLAVGRSSVKFAYIKASEGVGYVDPKFRRNALGAPAGGLKVGFYHYCRPETGNTAQQEAESFASAVNGIPNHLPHALDVEGAAGQIGGAGLTLWCYDWCKEVERLTGQRVIVYTGASFARSYLGGKLAEFGLWVAHYGVDTPMGNDTWDRWVIHQFADDGNVPGIVGSVDLNAMDAEIWKELTEVSEDQGITEDAARKVIALLGALHEASDNDDVKVAAHFAADKLREETGIEE